MTASPDATDPLELTVGDRVYVPARETTFEQDVWLVEVCRAAGIDRLTERLDPAASEQANAETFLHAVYKSGRAFDIMAGFLVEKGAQWTPTAAALTARRFADLTDVESKRRLTSVLVIVLAQSIVDSVSRTPSVEH